MFVSFAANTEEWDYIEAPRINYFMLRKQLIRPRKYQNIFIRFQRVITGKPCKVYFCTATSSFPSPLVMK